MRAVDDMQLHAFIVMGLLPLPREENIYYVC